MLPPILNRCNRLCMYEYFTIQMRQIQIFFSQKLINFSYCILKPSFCISALPPLNLLFTINVSFFSRITSTSAFINMSQNSPRCLRTCLYNPITQKNQCSFINTDLYPLPTLISFISLHIIILFSINSSYLRISESLLETDLKI